MGELAARSLVKAMRAVVPGKREMRARSFMNEVWELGHYLDPWA